MSPFALARPRTIDDAVELLADGATAIAGGTDLLGVMRTGLPAPQRLVDLTSVEGLRGVSRGPAGLSIGALTPLADLEADGDLARAVPIVREALAVAATPQLRAMGTVAGNLLQRNRCWYFRDEAFPCWLKGGERCYAREGDHRYHAIVGAQECVIASPSDLAPALIAYDARLTIRSAARAREIALSDLYVVPHGDDRREHSLGAGEVITEVTLPEPSLSRRGVYLKQMDRKAWSFALVSVALAARLDRGTLRDVRVVLGSVAPVPWRASGAERALEGARADERAADAAGAAAVSGAEPLEMNGYKVPLVHELVRRAVLRVRA